MDFKDPKNQVLILIILIFAALVYVWYDKFYSPHAQTLASKKRRLEDILTRSRAVEQKAASLDALQKEYEELRSRYEDLRMLLPEQKKDEDFLSQLHVSAQLSNSAVLSVIPQPSVMGEFYTSNPYAIELSSTYDGLGDFLARIANLPFIVTISDLQITGIEPPAGLSAKSQRRKDHVLSASFKLTTYAAREIGPATGGQTR